MRALFDWLAGSMPVARWAVYAGAFCTFAVGVVIVAALYLHWESRQWNRREED